MSDPNAPRRARRWPGVILLVLVLLPVLVYAIYRLELRRRVSAALDEVRRDGFPATVAELNEWYVEPPEDENAYEIMERAFARYSVARQAVEALPIVGTARLETRTDPLGDGLRQRTDAYIQAKEDTITLLHELGKTPRCRYPMDLSDGLDTLLPHLNKIRDCARLLGLSAVLCAESNEPTLAFERLRLSIFLADTLREEPLLISQLVRGACLKITISSAEQVINRRRARRWISRN